MPYFFYRDQTQHCTGIQIHSWQNLPRKGQLSSIHALAPPNLFQDFSSIVSPRSDAWRPIQDMELNKTYTFYGYAVSIE